MQTRGAVFFHPGFEFKNGKTGRKLILLLNTPSKNEPYLFVKTTSQRKNKPLSPGCIKERSLFFIPANTSFFKENTWVVLYERYPIRPNDIANKKVLKLIGHLDSKTLDKIIDCLFAAEDDDIPPIHRKLLRPVLHESILKLKEKFDSGK